MSKLDLPNTGYSRLPTILKHFPVSRSLWWQGVREGRFPRAYRNQGVTLWKNSELLAFLQAWRPSDG